jgi:hypothetical protein
MRLPLLLCYIVQDGFHIYFPVIEFVPIFLFWNLRVEYRLILADIFPLFLSDLRKFVRVARTLGVI